MSPHRIFVVAASAFHCGCASSPSPRDDAGASADASADIDASSAGLDAAADAGEDAAVTVPSCVVAFDAGDGRVAVSDTEGLFGSELTVELWLKLDAPQRSYQFILGAENPDAASALFLAVDEAPEGPELACIVREGSVWHGAGPRPMWPDLWRSWHHVACVRTDAKLSMFLDGVEVSYTPAAPPYQDAGGELLLGGLGADTDVPQSIQGSLEGEVDELRVSAGAAYDSDFVPDRRLAVEPGTLALWHFDECEGELAGGVGMLGARDALLRGSARWQPEQP